MTGSSLVYCQLYHSNILVHPSGEVWLNSKGMEPKTINWTDGFPAVGPKYCAYLDQTANM